MKPKRATADRPVVLAGRPVHLWLLDNIDTVVRTFSERVGEVIPVYQALPREQFRTDLASVVAATSRILAEVFRTRTMPGPEALGELTSSAARRADEGIPLSAVLAAYHVGCHLSVDLIIGDATADDLEEVHEAYRLLLELLARVTSAVSDAYLEASHVAVSEAESGKQAMLDALLTGNNPASVAARLGLSLAKDYAVLALAIQPHPDELDETVDRAVASRRKQRRIRHELEIISPEALLLITGETATVVLPSRASLDALVRQLGRAGGVAIVGASVTAPPEGVAAAATLAAEVLDVARSHGRTEGVATLEEYLIEYQFSRPTPAVAAFARMLQPLAEHADLLSTLRTYLLEEGMNRRRTAKTLHVHPNTVDYRLRKAGTLLELDLSDPVAVQRVVAALVATASGSTASGS